MPTLSKVIRTRDIIFKRLEQLGGKDYSDKKTLRQLVTVLDINNLLALDKEVKQALYLLTQLAIKEINKANKAKD
jgi:hypothetical protein